MKWRFIKIAFLLGVFFIPKISGQRLPDSDLLKGISLYQRNLSDSSAIYLNRYLLKDKANIDSHMYLGMIAFNDANYHEAINQFLLAENKQPGRASLMLAKSFSNIEETEKTIHYLDIHLKSKYKEAENKILLDKDLQKTDNKQEWIDFWKNNDSYSGFDNFIAEAEYLNKNGENLEAINFLSEGLKKGYRKSAIFSLRAKIYLEMGNNKLALDDITKSIDVDKRNAKLYATRGEIYLKEEKYKLALDDFNKSLNYQPLNFKLYIKRAITYQKTKLFDLALKDMNFYLLYFPEDDYAWFQFGDIYKEEKQYFDALKCFNKSISFDKANSAYYLSRGETYFFTRTYKYARNDFSMSLDIDPKNAKANYYAGKTNLLLGDKEAACFYFKRAYEYGMNEAYNELIKYCKENNN